MSKQFESLESAVSFFRELGEQIVEHAAKRPKNANDVTLSKFYVNLLFPMQQLYEFMMNLRQEDGYVRSTSIAVVSELTKIGFVDTLGEAMVSILKMFSRVTNKVPDIYSSLIICYFGIGSMITDLSDEACKKLGPDVIDGCLEILSNSTYKTQISKDGRDGTAGFVASVCLCIVHNMAKVSELKPHYIQVKAIDILTFYLDAVQDEKVQISAISAIACFLPDGQAAGFSDKHGILPKLTGTLQKALDQDLASKPHDYNGFTAEELVESLTYLAVNDANKAAIVKSGALPLLQRMLGYKDDLERKRAVSCLWTLSFSEDIRKQIVELPNCLDAIEAISNDTSYSNLEVRVSAKQAADYIRVGREGMTQISKSRNVAPDDSMLAEEVGRPEASSYMRFQQVPISAEPPQAEPSPQSGHIFISYSWKYQQTCLKIRDALKSAGHKVWMDVDQMHGSTLQAMAEAVEMASVVLVCYGDAYKQSNACRTEAEYMFRLAKPFVPLLMQNRYQSDGWLGIIIGARLYVDLSLQKYPFEEQLPKLLSEVQAALHPEEASQPSRSLHVPHSVSPRPDAPSNSSECARCKQLEAMLADKMIAQSVGLSVAKMTVEQERKIRQWTKADVQTWLSKGKLLQTLEKKFKDFDGTTLVSLYEMKCNAIDVYYKTVLELAGDALPECAILSAALDELMLS